MNDALELLESIEPVSRRNFLKRSVLLGSAVPVLGSLLAACGGDDDDDDDDDDDSGGGSEPTATEDSGGEAEPTPTEEPSDALGGTLIIDLGSEPENLDPHQQLAATTSLLTQQMFDALLTFAFGTVDLAPGIAEAWEVSDDALTYTFTLRDGVLFHDGTTCDAEAVKFSFERQLDETNEYNAMGSFTGGPNQYGVVDEITADDPLTVTFHLGSVLPAFLQRLTKQTGSARIVSPAAVMESGENFPESPVGAGPYMFNRWDKGQQVVLDRFDDYWDGTPSLDQVVFKAITEVGTRLASLLSGEVQMTVEISPEILESLEDSSDHTVVQGETGAVWFLALNTNSTGDTGFTAFEDVRVRQAIAHAINKDSLVNDVLNNTVTLAQGVFGPAWDVYNPEVEGTLGYDPDRAKELLAEAGWDEDTEVVFRTPDGGSGMLLSVEMAEVIQDNLREVGMKSKIEVQEFVAWMDAIRNPQNQLTTMSWNLPPTEPDRLLNGVLSESTLPPGFNTSYWVDAEFEEMLETGRSAVDPEDAKKAYQRAQMILVEQVPIIPVCHRRQLFGISNRVKNFELVPSMLLELTNVSVEG